MLLLTIWNKPFVGSIPLMPSNVIYVYSSLVLKLSPIQYLQYHLRQSRDYTELSFGLEVL